MVKSLSLLENPSKIYQDNFDPAKGNALQACIASIFSGCKLCDVPNFLEDSRGYEVSIKSFCEEGGVDAIKIPIRQEIYHDQQYNKFNKKLCLLRGKSPRGNFGHVVVARYLGDRFDMIHDPHPDETMLDTNEAFGWCFFFC